MNTVIGFTTVTFLAVSTGIVPSASPSELLYLRQVTANARQQNRIDMMMARMTLTMNGL